MNIYSYLEKDHRKVEDLFARIINARSEKKRQELFDEVAEELLLHAKTEHATFYNALREHPETQEIIQHADEEHQEMEKLIQAISKASAVNDKWLVQLGELKQAVQHHVNEEENEIFSKAKKILNNDQARQLAVDMDNLKKETIEIEVA